MKANFIDPDTKQAYYVQSFRMKIIDGEPAYFTKGILLESEKGNKYRRLDDNQRIDADHIIIGGETITRSQAQYEKDVKYLKQRAKDHAKSDDGRHMRHQAIDREMKSMGYGKK